MFATAPWTENLGLYNAFIVVGCLSIFIMFLAVPMMIWGKKMRIAFRKRYAAYAKMQPNPRGQVSAS